VDRFSLGAARPIVFISTSTFAYMYSALAFQFGFEYYGLLAGVVQLFASLATLFLQPLISSSASVHGWKAIQLFEIVAFVALSGLLLLVRLLRKAPWHSPSDKSSSISLQIEDGDGPVAIDDASLLSPQRSFSLGDVHSHAIDSTNRRRPNLFPTTDDILLIDGAHARYSADNYEIGKADEATPLS